jgi:hypothetical protein
MVLPALIATIFYYGTVSRAFCTGLGDLPVSLPLQPHLHPLAEFPAENSAIRCHPYQLQVAFLSTAIIGTTWIRRRRCVNECSLLSKMAPWREDTEGNGRAGVLWEA